MRALGLMLLLAGCTVTSPDPASDSGALPDDAGEPCLRALDVEPLGPGADRVLCPAPEEPRERVEREEARALLRELALLEHRYCEEDRARISWLSDEAWARELEIARTSGASPATLRVELDGFGVRRLEPLAGEATRGCTIEERAAQWIEQHRALFALDEGSALHLVSADGDTVRFDQRWRGLPVVHASLALRESARGFTRVEAHLLPAWAAPLSATPSVGAAAAIEVVREHGRPTGDATLAVWSSFDAREPAARLAWVIGACVVDAHDGSLVTCVTTE